MPRDRARDRGWSERIGEGGARERDRKKGLTGEGEREGGAEGGKERSLPSLGRESACSLRRTPGTVFSARTHVREPV